MRLHLYKKDHENKIIKKTINCFELFRLVTNLAMDWVVGKEFEKSVHKIIWQRKRHVCACTPGNTQNLFLVLPSGITPGRQGLEDPTIGARDQTPDLLHAKQVACLL